MHIKYLLIIFLLECCLFLTSCSGLTENIDKALIVGTVTPADTKDRISNKSDKLSDVEHKQFINEVENILSTKTAFDITPIETVKIFYYYIEKKEFDKCLSFAIIPQDKMKPEDFTIFGHLNKITLNSVDIDKARVTVLTKPTKSVLNIETEIGSKIRNAIDSIIPDNVIVTRQIIFQLSKIDGIWKISTFNWKE